ncbi:MAG: hypothetical protein ABI539_02495, partial [Acidobacteriota bacterium]
VPGYSDDNIVLIENGDVLELDEFGARVVEKHDLHKTFIDEESMGEIEYDIVRERKKLAYGGAVSLVVTIDRATHQLSGEPHISFQGVAGLETSNGFAAEARKAISDAIGEMKREQIADKTVFKENLRIHLKRLVQKRLQSKPVIVTTVVEI